jgi:hypothetical protein
VRLIARPKFDGYRDCLAGVNLQKAWARLIIRSPKERSRWHQTLKNRILLENYYLPGDLEAQIEAFVADYNHLRYHESIGHLRYHESIGNLTPADVYAGAFGCEGESG